MARSWCAINVDRLHAAYTAIPLNCNNEIHRISLTVFAIIPRPTGGAFYAVFSRLLFPYTNSFPSSPFCFYTECAFSFFSILFIFLFVFSIFFGTQSHNSDDTHQYSLTINRIPRLSSSFPDQINSPTIQVIGNPNIKIHTHTHTSPTTWQ